MCSKLTAHGEKLRGGKRRRQQASVSMATTTSPTATNFLLCWSRERRVGLWWWWWGVALELKTEQKTPHKCIDAHFTLWVISSNLHSVSPISLFLPRSPPPFLQLSWHEATPPQDSLQLSTAPCRLPPSPYAATFFPVAPNHSRDLLSLAKAFVWYLD